MKIHNIRFGFATNSSSSHSIIFDPINYSLYSDSNDSESFGWNFFTLASKAAKDEYMTAMLLQNISDSHNKNGFSNIFADIIVKGLGLKELDLDEISIDHQSLINLPLEYGTNHISVEFFQEFYNYIMRDEIIIFGGNDNEDTDEYPQKKYDTSIAIALNGILPKDTNASWVCRKDNDWWVLYNRANGARIIFSFLDNPEPFKPNTPILIDFKLTQFCDIGCKYCYQGSTKEGQHIDTNNIYKFVEDIADAEVFEIAIGGGEPTKCPSFISFITRLNNKGIKVNFTTKSIEWLENEPIANTVMNNIGAFAFSVGESFYKDIDTLNRIIAIMNYRKYDINKFTVQAIPGVMSELSLVKLLEWCYNNYIRVTLLGFKDTGRGARFKEIVIKRKYDTFDETKFIDVIKELYEQHKCPRIAIDTTLAKNCEHLLVENNIPSWLYHIEEGKYSAYIDGVDMKFGPSSYHLDKLIDYVGNSWCENVIQNLFNKIEEV